METESSKEQLKKGTPGFPAGATPGLNTRAASDHKLRQRAIAELGLEKYVLELEVDGYTVVPPEVTGVTPAQVDRLAALLLARSEELVGCPFSVEAGAECALDFGGYPGALELQSRATPSQFQLQGLGRLDRAFRDLAVNPVAVALARHLIGQRETRLSSQTAFVKWRGEGYGDSLGLHVDQAYSPQPWPRAALNMNCNWCLTEYTRANGAFAVVPGSQHRNCHPVMPQGAAEAIPVECGKGSLIAWHGATWHGAFPRTTEGLRLTVAHLYRHNMVTPQEDYPACFPRELAEDCADPQLFRQLAGFGSIAQFTQTLPVPKAAGPRRRAKI